MTREIGTIKAIYRYPVKSMAGQRLESASVGWHGIDGDRRFAFARVGAQNGFPWLTASKMADLLRYAPLAPADNEQSAPTHVRTPAGRELELFGRELEEEVSAACGAEVRLMRLDQGIFDEAKVSLISMSTIAAVEREAGIRLDVARFRPNILLETSREEPFGEDEWVGKILSIGDRASGTSLNVYMRDVRCVMINLDPLTADADARVLKAVVRMNDNNAGVYAAVMRTGLIATGDKVYLQDS